MGSNLYMILCFSEFWAFRLDVCRVFRLPGSCLLLNKRTFLYERFCWLQNKIWIWPITVRKYSQVVILNCVPYNACSSVIEFHCGCSCFLTLSYQMYKLSVLFNSWKYLAFVILADWLNHGADSTQESTVTLRCLCFRSSWKRWRARSPRWSFRCTGQIPF